MNHQGKTETILAVVPGEGPNDRLVLALESGNGEKPMVLRTESFSSDVGWFTQGILRMSRREFSGLKNVLGLSMARGCNATAIRVQESQAASDEPRVLSFAEARRA